MKKVKLITLILLAFSLILTPIFGGCAEETSSKKVVKIGLVATLTGTFAEDMLRVTHGAESAAAWINSEGGITVNGEEYLIEIVAEDSKGTPEGGLAAVNKLIYDDQVKFIIGGDLPFICTAEAEVTEEAQAVFIVLTSSMMTDLLNTEHPLTFNGFESTVAIPDAYDYLVENYPQAKTIALLCPDSPDAINVRDNVKQEAVDRGLSIVCEEAYEAGTTDFYPVWTKILATEPDAVNCVCGLGTWWADIIKQGRELGFDGQIFAADCDGDITTIPDIAGKDYAEGFFAPQAYLQSSEMPSLVKEIVQIISDTYGEGLTGSHVNGWEDVWFLAQAIEAAQSLDPVQVAEAFENLESIEGCFGTGHMEGLQTYGVTHVVVTPMAISQVVNGEWKHIEWITPSLP